MKTAKVVYRRESCMGALHLSKLFGIQKNLGENGITPMKQLICLMEFVLSVAYLQYAFPNAFELFLKTIGIYFKKNTSPFWCFFSNTVLTMLSRGAVSFTLWESKYEVSAHYFSSSK